MSAFSKLLALTSGILVGLPPGWCCAAPSPKAAELPPQPVHSCCQHEQPMPDKEPAPAQPIQKCCCEKDLASPPSPETTSPELAISIPLAIPDAPALLAAGVSDLCFTDHFSSPPLHVLQCVWRC